MNAISNEADLLPANIPVSDKFFSVLVAFLGETKAALRRDPVLSRGSLERLEWLLIQTRTSPRSEQKAAAATGGLAPWQAARVKSYIDANLTERLCITDLAALVHLSGNHFARAFKKTFGCPPHAYVVQRRLLHAKMLIVETDLPLSQIALEAGMADQSHLSRCFRRSFEVTPSACRGRDRVSARTNAPSR